jgi:4-hydroxyphenylpyruvate dioxygenase-like putative hemolysin
VIEVAAFSHVGFAVDSAQEFMRTWGAALCESWTSHVEEADGGVVVDGVDHGPLQVTVAFTRIANLPVELIETTRGVTTHSRWVDSHGPSLHHLAFWVDDLAASVARAREAGMVVAMAPGGTAQLVSAPEGSGPGLVTPQGSGSIPDFFAFLELPGAHTRWVLELLDASAAPAYREANGDYPCYP